VSQLSGFKHRRRDKSARRGRSSILVVVLDEAGLTEALPVAVARAQATGCRLTVAGIARVPIWTALAAGAWMLLLSPLACDGRAYAELALREAVERIAEGAAPTVVCHPGRVEGWLGAFVRRGGFDTILVGTSGISARRANRLARIVGSGRTFAVLTPLERVGSRRPAAGAAG
jgi:nucleotide-binding universal stress UspA family protein